VGTALGKLAMAVIGAAASYLFLDRRVESKAKAAQPEITARVHGTIRSLLFTIGLNGVVLALLYAGWYRPGDLLRGVILVLWTIPNAIALWRSGRRLGKQLRTTWSGEVARRAVSRWLAENRGTRWLLVVASAVWLVSWLASGGYWAYVMGSR